MQQPPALFKYTVDLLPDTGGSVPTDPAGQPGQHSTKCTTLGPRSFSSAFSSDPLQVGQGWGGPGSKGEARCPGAIQGSQKWPDKAQTQLATERICPSKIHFVIQMNLHFLTKTGNICKTTRIKLENKLPLCTKVNTHRKATIAYLKKKRKCSFMFDI